MRRGIIISALPRASNTLMLWNPLQQIATSQMTRSRSPMIQPRKVAALNAGDSLTSIKTIELSQSTRRTADFLAQARVRESGERLDAILGPVEWWRRLRPDSVWISQLIFRYSLSG